MAARKDAPEAKNARPVRVEIERTTINAAVVNYDRPPAPVDDDAAIGNLLEAARRHYTEAFAILKKGNAKPADRRRAKQLEAEADASLLGIRQYLKDR